jgi:hypothetical protein
MKSRIAESTLVLIALGIVYAALTVVAQGMQDVFAQILLVGTGSAIFASGLTFFLLRIFQQKDDVTH